LNDDARWMGAALAIGARSRGRTFPNPGVGCVIVKHGRMVGRGCTAPSGRPHAEAQALAQAGDAARGATAYVTLEPCATPGRGPACADLLIEAGVACVVAAAGDPFPAVDGKGFAKVRAGGIAVRAGVCVAEAERSMAGFLTRQRFGRPHITLKLALSLDGCIAMADGSSRWITGHEARAHGHLERARHEAILVGRGTWEADAPQLDVRLPGLEARRPVRYILSATHVTDADDSIVLPGIDRIGDIAGDHLLVEGGMHTAASFLAADLVDRLLLYRAPLLIGGGRSLPDIGLHDLAKVHGRWTLHDSRMLGSDRLDVYERVRG
jgi:diaminohydroxyphosphoribosylaminopyrimidine deaminase / 5-amino-6-(5-phosphoribosylamino)uracil reductase